MPITLEEYFMGRDKLYLDEFTEDIASNARVLLLRVNKLLEDLKFDNIRVRSGWRPYAVNKAVNGAKGSLHMMGKAIDIADNDNKLARTIMFQPKSFLHDHDLWMEEPRVTPSWIHLDCGVRPSREPQIFLP